jgi:hypothetical protein
LLLALQLLLELLVLGILEADPFHTLEMLLDTLPSAFCLCPQIAQRR